MTDSGCTLDIHDIQAGNTISIAFPIILKEKLDATNRHCKQLATATMQAHSFVTRRQVILCIMNVFYNYLVRFSVYSQLQYL